MSTHLSFECAVGLHRHSILARPGKRRTREPRLKRRDGQLVEELELCARLDGELVERDNVSAVDEPLQGHLRRLPQRLRHLRSTKCEVDRPSGRDS